MQRALLMSEMVRALTAIQEDAGQDCPPITELTVPLKDLPGFDSLAGIELEIRVSGAIGQEVEKIELSEMEKDLTVGQIVDNILLTLGRGVE